jgi:lactoylglutathione lyase
MTQLPPPHGLLRKVDCVQIPVPELDGGLAFYRDRLGHELIWRSQTAVGLRLADSDSELVLQTQRPQPEVDFLVDSVDQAATQLTMAGGTVLVEPADIPVGRVAVVADPFGNPGPHQGSLRDRRRRQRDGRHRRRRDRPTADER